MAKTWVQSGKIEARLYGQGVSELACPRCGAHLLHHTGVRVFDRPEDAATVVETEVSQGRIDIDTRSDGMNNPSARRDGIIVDFECEGCGSAPIELRLAQHKGSTEISWGFERDE